MIVPPEVEPAAAIPRLTAALESGAVAVVLVQRASDAPELWRDALLHLLPVIRRHDVALLLENQPELAVAHDCDGVQIDDIGALDKTRKIIGSDRSLGVVCHDSRHLAMESGEAGADYVAFAPNPELLGWWTAIATLPCVSLPVADNASLSAILASGVEFLGLGSAFWADPRSNETVMAELSALLASAH